MSDTPPEARAEQALLLLDLGEDCYALPAGQVEIVLRNDLPRTEIPTAPAHVPAVVNHRGRALPILDVEAFLDLPREGERGRLVVLRAADMSVALPARRIRGIRSLATRPAEPGLRFALGLVDLEEGAAQVLDIPALLRAAAARGRR
ncbi:MAG TPA: hypothetical protein DEA08_02680 [Planctomycetes bacterium]|nr:hypothetical protein [Planctomycetota bacterium]